MTASSLTAAQLAALKSKVTGTPPLLALWQAGTPVPIAEALSDPANATYGGTVTLAAADHDDLLVALRPSLSSLPGLTTQIQDKWDRVRADIHAAISIKIDPAAIALFNSAVSDGVLTQAQAQACYQRPGSWAEVEFGAGTTLAWQDVVAAMNS